MIHSARELESALICAGYARNPNQRLFGMPGSGWYPAGPGVPEIPNAARDHVRVRPIGELADIVVCRLIVASLDWEIVARFDTVSELFAWCKREGGVSLPGHRHF